MVGPLCWAWVRTPKQQIANNSAIDRIKVLPSTWETRQIAPLVLALTFAFTPTCGARAAEALSGRDAAYIDWGVKYCEAVSTDKEHAMVELANAKARDDFVQQYTKEVDQLAAAASPPERREKMCSDIKDWYGPLGNRIADLLRWKQDVRSDGKPKSAGTSDKRKGKRPSVQW